MCSQQQQTYTLLQGAVSNDGSTKSGEGEAIDSLTFTANGMVVEPPDGISSNELYVDWIDQQRAQETRAVVADVLRNADERMSLPSSERGFTPESPHFAPGALQDAPPVDEVPATSTQEELAKKLANPIASLISVPFQFNYDQNIGPANDGSRMVLNIQPVIPISLNEDWNLISRTIVPLTHQNDIFPGAGDQTGMGDIVQSLFFSPTKPTDSGWIWGAGPVFLLPTATHGLLGGE